MSWNRLLARVGRVRAGALALGLAVSLFAVIASPAGATFAGQNGTLAWAFSAPDATTSTATDTGIALIPGGVGTSTTTVTNGRSSTTLRYCNNNDVPDCLQWAHLSYSPNGGTLAYDVNGDQVEVGNLSLTNVRNVGRADFAPSFSPNGRRLVYVERQGAGEKVVTSDLFGGNVVVLARMIAADPQFSPNGRQVLFAHNNGLWLVNVNGKGLREIVRNARAGNWSPNGGQIVYVNTNFGAVYTALANGTGQHELPAYASCASAGDCNGESDFAVFSPDGKYIAFDSSDHAGDPAIFTALLHGLSAKQVDVFNTGGAYPSDPVLGLSWQSVG